MIAFTVAQYRRYPKEARFMGNLWSSPEMLDEHAIQAGNTMAGPLKDLFNRIAEDDHYDTATPDIMASFFSVPSLVLRQDPKLSTQKLDQISTMLIKAITK